MKRFLIRLLCRVGLHQWEYNRGYNVDRDAMPSFGARTSIPERRRVCACCDRREHWEVFEIGDDRRFLYPSWGHWVEGWTEGGIK